MDEDFPMLKHQNPRHREETVEWARAMLNSGAVILDFETTGIRNAEIVQIGMIDMRGQTLMQTLARPRGRIPAEVVKVHGITDAMVAEAPGFEALYVPFSTLVAGRTVIAYNAAFEEGILQGVCARRGLPIPRLKEWSCAMKAYARYYGECHSRYGGYKWQSLGKACAQQNIPVRGAHDALSDCRMTLELIRAMAAG
ncbi:MAG: exonuclease domain-containing protein [Chloroflexota bacterium]